MNLTDRAPQVQRTGREGVLPIAQQPKRPVMGRCWQCRNMSSELRPVRAGVALMLSLCGSCAADRDQWVAGLAAALGLEGGCGMPRIDKDY